MTELNRLASQLQTAAWFATRPTFWAHAVALGLRKLKVNHDTPAVRATARLWAAESALSNEEALCILGFDSPTSALATWEQVDTSTAEHRVELSPMKLGGAGALQLIFACVLLTKAERIVETGVAYGWSSFAMLSALDLLQNGKLFSVDMPYPKLHNEKWVGCAVNDSLRTRWTLIRRPDRNGLTFAIRKLGGSLDLAHYDSDKSWWGRKFAYPRIWKALNSGGLFISDDIQDNFYFKEFATRTGAAFAVVEANGKYVGLIRKP